ncbi:MAG TPA: Gfo/Idh/MocA family oxidoreductase [Bryobacteraceae bacterium]|nr:Gfo/Idh/MocA family oxidoreductase [Bryobacteraceae bacterium]
MKEPGSDMGEAKHKDSRRRFIGTVAGGLAAAASPGRVLGANQRIRLGVIGPGARGMELVQEALACANTEIVAFADVYTRRLEDARRVVPSAKTFLDYRYLLEDQTIDAVIIATPQHLHCEHFVASLEAGKHVYQEKTMAFTVEHAKRMRAAYKQAGRKVVQIGHQACSSGQMADAVAFCKTGYLGRITAIHAHHYRNTPHGKPQWSRPVYPDMTPENILWKAFLGEAPERPFDANRYINWRFFWDYSGGNVYENMCHQLAFWYKALNLQIPTAVTMTGGLYLWKDGREVPDTMNVAMEHPEEILFSWDSGFGNNHLGYGEFVLGTDGTIVRSQQIRYLPQKVNRPDGEEILGQTRTAPNAHMQNFLDAIRNGAEPNCPFEIGFRVSIACRMAVESYRQGRTMRWDPAREEIV